MSFTPIEIDELLDGETIRIRGAVVAFQQDDVTYKGSIRSNPPRQINALNQAQLEAELGSDLEIPNLAGIKVVIDNLMPLSTSFKLGLASTLNATASTPNNILLVSPPVVFENTDPLEGIISLDVCNLIILSVGASSVVDTHGLSAALTRFRDTVLIGFDSIGTTNTGGVIIEDSSMQTTTKGLVIREAANVKIDTFSVVNTISTGITAVSFIADATPSTVTIRDLRALGFFAGDSLLFIDPNSPAGSRYVIESSSVVAGDFFQQGVDIAINSVADNGSGKARFTTAVSHNLVVGRPTVISGFVTETTYNKTVIVTAVDTPLTGTTFDVEEIDFTVTDTGNVNNASLDQTSSLVVATANIGSPDSKNIGSIVATGNTTPTTIDTQGVFVDFNMDASALAGSNIELWSVADSDTAELEYFGIDDFNGTLAATITIEPNGSKIYDIRMIVNGSPTVDAVVSRVAISGTVTTIPFVAPLSVVTGDLVKLQILEEDGTDNPTITDLSISAQNP